MPKLTITAIAAIGLVLVGCSGGAVSPDPEGFDSDMFGFVVSLVGVVVCGVGAVIMSFL